MITKNQLIDKARTKTLTLEEVHGYREYYRFERDYMLMPGRRTYRWLEDVVFVCGLETIVREVIEKKS